MGDCRPDETGDALAGRWDDFGTPPGWPSRRNPLSGFIRDKPLAALGGAIAILLVVVAVLAPVITTHDPDGCRTAPHAGGAQP